MTISPQEDFQMVFLIGAARSGTRLLRDLIAMHPEVNCVPYDINFIWRLGNEHLPHDELTPEIVTPEIRRRVRNKVRKYHSNGKILLEKTVSNCLRIPFLMEIFPDARFIHLLRNGTDVIESSYRQWTAPPNWRYILKKAIQYPITDAFGYAAKYAWTTVSKLLPFNSHRKTTWGPQYQGIHKDLEEKTLLEVCAIQWSRCVQTAWEHLSLAPPDTYITTRFEEIVSNPVVEMEKIAGFLNINADCYHSIPYQDIIQPSYIGKGAVLLSATQKAIIQPYCEEIQTTITPQ